MNEVWGFIESWSKKIVDEIFKEFSVLSFSLTLSIICGVMHNCTPFW